MPTQPLEELAQRAAAGDQTAADLFLDRLQHVLGLLDRATLQKAVRSTLSLADGLTPEMRAQARRPLTQEEVDAALRELKHLRDQVDKGGGLELQDFLPELEQMGPCP